MIPSSAMTIHYNSSLFTMWWPLVIHGFCNCLLICSIACSTDVDIFGLNRQQSEMRDGLCLLLSCVFLFCFITVGTKKTSAKSLHKRSK